MTERNSHFEFGENWKEYSASINQTRIDAAVAGMRKLFPDGLAGKTFLDIGCGSGVHSLAALQLGAKEVTAVDIDENSVATTTRLLSDYAAGKPWTASLLSIFDVPETMNGRFDVVYSWGVLHHTGDMWRAIGNAVKLVAPAGQFAVAIYAKTKMDKAWVAEKRLYSRSPKFVQWMIRQPYAAMLLAGLAAKGRNPMKIIANYANDRGMRFANDIHDWLGGYPYETASADELQRRIEAMGFQEVRSFRLNVSIGLFGSGCHEHVFIRRGE